MGLIKLVVGPIQENTYIYYDEEDRSAAVIDPGGEAGRILEALKNKNLRAEVILLTHGHYDHTGAVKSLVSSTSNLESRVFAHADEEALLLDPRKSHAEAPVKVGNFLRDGEEISVGGKVLRCIHTPGHTAGSCCYYAESDGLLFTGDTLFKESIGRYDLPTGDRETLYSSVKDKLYALPDDTCVLPGHMDETTIGYEKKHNDFVRA